MHRLVVFDVDGTLCDTCSVDDELFCAATSAQLGVSILPESWRHTPHVTDTGIANWLWTQHRGRAPTPVESEEFAVAFESLLRSERDGDPSRFAAVAGAGAFLRHLGSQGWRFAIATGGRARTARFKLEAAGLPATELLASSDDSPDRREIFALARQRFTDREGDAPTHVVLVGDGTWDVRTAAQLGWSMVGVGTGERAEQLRRAGAGVVIADFSDQTAALAALEQAHVPRAG